MKDRDIISALTIIEQMIFLSTPILNKNLRLVFHRFICYSIHAMKVVVGTRIEVELLTDDGGVELLSADIVSDESADFKQGFLGQTTPLANALLGHSAGDMITYPVGDIIKVRILSVVPSTRQPPEGLQERRAEATRKAVAESDRTNAILFASSFSGKWGDYDPAGLDHWSQDHPEEDKKEN